MGAHRWGRPPRQPHFESSCVCAGAQLQTVQGWRKRDGMATTPLERGMVSQPRNHACAYVSQACRGELSAVKRALHQRRGRGSVGGWHPRARPPTGRHAVHAAPQRTLHAEVDQQRRRHHVGLLQPVVVAVGEGGVGGDQQVAAAGGRDVRVCEITTHTCSTRSFSRLGAAAGCCKCGNTRRPVGHRGSDLVHSLGGVVIGGLPQAAGAAAAEAVGPGLGLGCHLGRREVADGSGDGEGCATAGVQGHRSEGRTQTHTV